MCLVGNGIQLHIEDLWSIYIIISKCNLWNGVVFNLIVFGECNNISLLLCFWRHIKLINSVNNEKHAIIVLHNNTIATFAPRFLVWNCVYHWNNIL